MILGNAYGGSLKAWLTYPARTQPISNLIDILESGLPWKMVLYGEVEETLMQESKDPIIQAIWNGKTVTDFTPVLELDGVANGDEVFIDYKTGLTAAIQVQYSTPSGDPLVHIAPNPVVRNTLSAWGFQKFNPWRPQFDRVMRRILEAGLADHFKSRTLARMKREHLESGKVKLDKLDQRPTISPLSVDDLQGFFYVALFGFSIGLLIFIIELCLPQFTTTSPPDSSLQFALKEIEGENGRWKNYNVEFSGP